MPLHPVAQRLRLTVTPAMATPLTADGYRVDLDGVPALVDFLVERGVGGLFVGGTTGEGILLEDADRRALHAAAVRAAAGRVPVLAHAGANDTRRAVRLAAQAAADGADVVVALTPYFYGLADDALLAYCRAIADAVAPLPFMVYDIPQLAMNGVSPTLLRRLADALPNFAGLKTSRTDIRPIRELIDAAPDHVTILAGNEPIMLGSLALGAHGAISGLATAVPEPFVALLRAFAAGDLATAQATQRRINRLLAVFPPGERIGGIKAILAARGVPVGPPVPPRPPGSAELWPQMQAVLHA